MNGPELATFCEELNGGASIGSTLLFQHLNLAKSLVEQKRPWAILRYTDTSKTAAAGNNWQTGIDLSDIARFNRFYIEDERFGAIHLFDGSQRIEHFHQIPYEQRLHFKDTPNRFAYHEATKTLYLMGTVPFSGTLYIDHIKDSEDLENDEASSWAFPSWSHPLLGYYAVAINKGGIDYDEVNARMAPENRAEAARILSALEGWDAEKALSAVSSTDPYQDAHGYRSGAIDMSA